MAALGQGGRSGGEGGEDMGMNERAMAFHRGLFGVSLRVYCSSHCRGEGGSLLSRSLVARRGGALYRGAPDLYADIVVAKAPASQELPSPSWGGFQPSGIDLRAKTMKLKSAPCPAALLCCLVILPSSSDVTASALMVVGSVIVVVMVMVIQCF